MNLWNHVDEAPEGNENEFVFVKNWRWGRKKKNFTRVRRLDLILRGLKSQAGVSWVAKTASLSNLLDQKINTNGQKRRASSLIHITTRTYTHAILFLIKKKKKFPNFFTALNI